MMAYVLPPSGLKSQPCLIVKNPCCSLDGQWVLGNVIGLYPCLVACVTTQRPTAGEYIYLQPLNLPSPLSLLNFKTISLL